MNIANNIKKYRKEMNASQKELAEYLKVDIGTISRYESGTVIPDIEKIEKLAIFFNVNIEDMLKDENSFDINKIDILEILKEQKEMGLKGNLYHYTQVAFSYNTNHIEGSTLSEDQTKYIYDTKSLFADNANPTKIDDIFETINHFHLFNYMLDNVDKKLTENMIKDFHKILKSNTSDSEKDWFNVGDYKTKTNYIGSDIKTTSPKLVPAQMQKLLEWYNEKKNPTFNDIVEFHVRFEKIHPFQDGNGRIGRLIMFKECLKNNITPFIILDKDKYFYYKGLKEYNTEKGYLIDTLLHEQDEYINMIKRYMK